MLTHLEVLIGVDGIIKGCDGKQWVYWFVTAFPATFFTWALLISFLNVLLHLLSLQDWGSNILPQLNSTCLNCPPTDENTKRVDA